MVKSQFALPHVALVMTTDAAVGPPELATVAVRVNVHPFASFTVMEYVPGAMPVYDVCEVKLLPFTE